MRGKKAKQIARIIEKFEPRYHKHGARMYSRDPQTGQIVSEGFRRMYQSFKRVIKRQRMHHLGRISEDFWRPMDD